MPPGSSWARYSGVTLRHMSWCAGIALALLLPLAPPAAAHPEEPFGGNPVTSLGGGVETNAGRLLAQSFRPSADLVLFRVELNLSDAGTSGPASLSIAPDAGGRPGSPGLAGTALDAGSAFAWVSAALPSPVSLVAGVPYWIVLTDGRVPGDGHLWWNSGYDANTTGAAAEFAGSWSGRSDDFAFLLYGHDDYAVDLVLTTSADIVTPSCAFEVRFEVSLSGRHTLAVAWLNVTLDQNLSYAGDDADAGSVNVSRTTDASSVRYTLREVAPGRHAFRLRIDVDAAAVPGSTRNVSARLEYLAANGTVGQAPDGLGVVLVRGYQVTLSSNASASRAVPGSDVAYWINITNDPTGATVTSVRARFEFLENGVFTDASPGATVTTVNVTWPATDLVGGSSAAHRADGATAVVAVPSAMSAVRALVTFVENGTTWRLLDTLLETRADVPDVDVALASSVGLLRSRDAFSLTFRVDNNGTGTATDVWVNFTLDPRLEFRGDDRVGGDLVLTGAGISWRFRNVSVGGFTYHAFMAALAVLQDGSRIGNLATVDATDGLGHKLPRAYSSLVTLELAGPRISVRLTAPSARLRPGDLIEETVLVQNQGRDGARSLSLTQSLGGGLRFVQTDSTASPTFAGGLIAWAFTDLSPGEAIEFQVTFQVDNEESFEAVLGLSLTATYSDAYGDGSAEIVSSSVLVRVTPQEGFVTLANPLVAAAILMPVIAGVVLGLRRLVGAQEVQDVLLIRKDGTLVAHRSRASLVSRDPDTFSAMFTAIQDFVRDSFAYHGDRGLKSLSFGDLEGSLAFGENLFLAAIYRGRAGVLFPRVMEKTLGTIEREHGRFLATWDGDRAMTRHIEALLEPVLRAGVSRLVHAPTDPVPVEAESSLSILDQERP